MKAFEFILDIFGWILITLTGAVCAIHIWKKDGTMAWLSQIRKIS